MSRQQTCGAEAAVDSQDLPHPILLIFYTATGMAWSLTQSGFSRALAAAMTGLPGGSARCRVPPTMGNDQLPALAMPRSR